MQCDVTVDETINKLNQLETPLLHSDCLEHFVVICGAGSYIVVYDRFSKLLWTIGGHIEFFSTVLSLAADCLGERSPVKQRFCSELLIQLFILV